MYIAIRISHTDLKGVLEMVFLSLPLLLLCNDLNMVKITFLYLLFVNTAFEGYKWPWIENSFQHLKLLH